MKYPCSLTAHDIGLKNLLEAFYLLGNPPEVILYAVSIAPLPEMGMKLSPQLVALVPEDANNMVKEVDS